MKKKFSQNEAAFIYTSQEKLDHTLHSLILGTELTEEISARNFQHLQSSCTMLHFELIHVFGEIHFCDTVSMLKGLQHSSP